MKKRKISSLFSILASNRGESLTETLVAMLIISLSMAFLASNIAGSVRMGKNTAQEDSQNLSEWNHAERAIHGEFEIGEPQSIKDTKIVVKFDDGTEHYEGKVSNSSEDGFYYTYWLKDENTNESEEN